MSSDSSVSFSASSRIRQFGLYRTIDARTEEFLKQSRKRQVKQGCVCATISTAITVTVVITAFLIYMETGINKDSSKQTITKSSWNGLINDSIFSPFDEKFSKSKLNFDRATIKLLPVLIKALKQNRFLEKIIEDYSSSSPVYEGRVTTDMTVKKNLFNNKNNWMKKPTSRMYTIEYKTSPILFTYNNANTKLAYFTKIRKIRDYNRIMQYFDKTNSDKDNDHTLSMFKVDYNTVTKKTPNYNVNSLQKTSKSYSRQSNRSKLSKIISNNKKNNEVVGCKCASQMNMFYDKIISSIQAFLPGVKLNSKPKFTTQSNTQNKTTRINTGLIKEKKTLPSHLSEFNNVLQIQDNTNSIEFESILHKENFTVTSADQHFDSNINIKSVINGMKDNEAFSTLTSVKQSIEPTEFKKIFYSTQPITPVLDITQTKNLITTTRKYFSQYGQKNVDDKSSKHINKHSIVKLTLNQEINPFVSSYSPTAAKEISNLDKSSIELFKSKILPSYHHSSQKPASQRYSNRHLSTIKKSAHLKSNVNQTTYNFDKLSKVNYSRIGENVSKDKEIIHSTPLIAQVDYKVESQSNESLGLDYHANIPSTKKTDVKSVMNTIKTILNAEKNNNLYNLNVHSSTIEEIEPTHDNDYHEEYYVKPTESMTSLPFTLINNTVFTKNLTANTNKEDMWDFLSSNYDRTKLKSMIPIDRPTYLEIHRNAWPVDDKEDYDLNMKYNVFDLL